MHSSKWNWINLITPSSIGTLTAAILAVIPSASVESQRLSGVFTKITLILFGFASSYLSVKGLIKLRLLLLKKLFAYHYWLLKPRARSTKLWALAIKVLRGPKPFKTFTFQDLLSKQPLPDLNETLDLWLKVSRQLVSEEEFKNTVKCVQEMRTVHGPVLQKHLEKKSKNISWLSDYWLQAAYLACRKSLAINSSFFLSSQTDIENKTKLIPRASTWVHYFLKMHQEIKRQVYQPRMLMDLVPLCMDGYKGLFGTCRKPNKSMDIISKNPDSQHIVVNRLGKYFKLQVYENNEVLSIGELFDQLTYIYDQASTLDHKDESNYVSCLTTLNRDDWSENRDKLKTNNENTLTAIETSLFSVILDEFNPVEREKRGRDLLVGKGWDKWFDLGINSSFYQDGSAGWVVEHSTIDAMVSVTAIEYAASREKYIDENIVPEESAKPRRKLDLPEPLIWNLDQDLKDSIRHAKVLLDAENDRLQLKIIQAPFGKGVIKKCKLSPDGFIQMAYQLAYFRKYGKVAKTYEPATGRLFQLGRTETINPVSEYSVQWMKAMVTMDKSSSTGSKVDKADRSEIRGLLKKAVENQNNYRLKATMAKACDRHLTALYCASRELGMDVPSLYTDSAWYKDYILSTSQTPCEIYEIMNGKNCNFLETIGGFGPGSQNGYGLGYVLYGNDIILCTITSYSDCKENSVNELAEEIKTAFIDMRNLFQ